MEVITDQVCNFLSELEERYYSGVYHM